MKLIKINLKALKFALATIIVTTFWLAGASYSATPIGTQFTAEQRLKLGRLAARNRQNIDLDSYIELGDKREEAFDENNSECGNVNIGNVERPRIGSNVEAPDVIIAGDILVLADDC